jgi:hypothetical protein
VRACAHCRLLHHPVALVAPERCLVEQVFHAAAICHGHSGGAGRMCAAGGKRRRRRTNAARRARSPTSQPMPRPPRVIV